MIEEMIKHPTPSLSLSLSLSLIPWYDNLRPLQFNYVSYEHFWKKKSCQTPKKKKKKVTFGVLRTKVVLKFSVRLPKKKESASFKNILCKGDSLNYSKLSLL